MTNDNHINRSVAGSERQTIAFASMDVGRCRGDSQSFAKFDSSN